ncbi:hypothetical protein [Streptomyces sp. SLBN-8D4]|uniref:hypothetical protein n=1 Tax=Streptomyces sp. SLBN-8D4 TaxID=3377728 RepID=UPI003C7B5929
MSIHHMEEAAISDTMAGMITVLFYVGVCLSTCIWFFLKARHEQSLRDHSWRRVGLFAKRRDKKREKNFTETAKYIAGTLTNYGLTPPLDESALSKALLTADRARHGRVASFQIQSLWAFPLVVFPILAAGRLDPRLMHAKSFWKITYGPGFGLQIGSLVIFVVLLISTNRTHKARLAADGFVSAVRETVTCLRIFLEVRSGKAQPIELDAAINDLCRDLTEYAHSGQVNVPSVRRQELALHVQAVTATLEDASRQLLTRGWADEPRVFELLTCVLSRLIQGRWHGLLDESEFSERGRNAVSQIASDATDSKKDQRVVLLGIVASFVVVALATVAGAPAGITLGLAGVAAITPAASSGRLGMSPGSAFQQVRDSFQGRRESAETDDGSN